MRWYVAFAWVLLVVCCIAWPLSVATFAKDEPISILSLSWIALILTAVNILVTTKVRKRQEED